MVSFKNKIITGFLAVTLLFSAVPSYAASHQGIDNKKSEISSAEEKLDSLQALIEKKQKELNQIAGSIKDTETKIKSKLTDEQMAIDELQFLKESIENYNNEIERLEQEHEKLETEFLERSRIMYQSSKTMDILSILFTSKDIFDFVGKLDVHKKMVEEDNRLMEELRFNEEDLATKKAMKEDLFANSEILLAEIEQAIKDLNANNEIYDAKYSELQALINKMEQQEQSYYTEIDELASELNRLEKEYAAAVEAEKEEARRKLEEAKKKAEEINEGSAVSAEEANFCWPLASYVKITSQFGYRTHPINKTWSLHTGVDLAAAAGTKIYAAQAGTVELAGTNGGFGLCVIINHGNGLKTLYGHCSKLLVSKGQTVTRGQNIALVGMTGSATGNHLHFEVQERQDNGKYTSVQPLNYVTAP